MKINDTLMGFASLDSKEYPFIFEKNILQLFPNSKQAWKQEQQDLLKSLIKLKYEPSQEWIGYSFIKAISNNGNHIVFCVSDDASNNNGFISYVVVYLFMYNPNLSNGEDIERVCFSGNLIDAFFDPTESFNVKPQFEENDSIKAININVKNDLEISVGTYEYQNTKINIRLRSMPIIKFKDKVPLETKSLMKFEFSSTKDLLFVIDIFSQLRRFFFYVCGSIVNDFEDIQVFNRNSDQHGICGMIRTFYSEYEGSNKNINHKNIINYHLLEDKTISLFEAIIKEDNLYFDHFRAYTNAPNSYGIDRIILDFVAFEREYRNFYDKSSERSKDYFAVKDEISTYLNILKTEKTGKRKKYVKEFIKTLENTEITFSDKVTKSLNDCEDILLPFLQHDYENYTTKMIKEIGDRLNKLRNDSVHGNIDLQIDPINLSDFSTIENLIYAIRLKGMGLKKNRIQKAIKNLKNYNISVN